MFTGVRRRTNSHHVSLEKEESPQRTLSNFNKNSHTQRLSLKTMHNDRYSQERKKPCVSEAFKSNPDVYFKPEVKNSVYRTIVDVYIQKKQSERGQSGKILPSLALEKCFENRLAKRPYMKKKSEIQSRKFIRLPTQPIETQRQNQIPEKKLQKTPKKRPNPIQTISNGFLQKLPVINETKFVEEVPSPRRKKRSTTVWTANENPEGKNFIRHRSDVSVSSADDSFEGSLGAFDEDSPGIKGQQYEDTRLRALSQSGSNRSLLRRTQNIVNNFRLRKNLWSKPKKIKNWQSEKSTQKSEDPQYITNLYKIQQTPCDTVTQQKVQTKIFSKNLFKAHKMMNVIQKVACMEVSLFWKKKQAQKPQQTIIYTAPVRSCLRQELFTFKVDVKVIKEEVVKIIPKKEYYKLFQNDCEFFADIIRSVAIELQKVNGQAINNMLSMENLYRMGEKDIRVGDWGCAAVKERLKIGGEPIEVKDQPVIKDDSGWLVTPENLPPEIIKLIIEEKYTDIWELSTCPEVWSIGLIIFEILFMIPVWMPSRAGFGKQTPRKGLFYSQYRQLQKILQLQQRIPLFLSKWLREEKEKLTCVRPEIIKIMKGCLHPNPSKRLTLSKILAMLQ